MTSLAGSQHTGINLNLIKISPCLIPPAITVSRGSILSLLPIIHLVSIAPNTLLATVYFNFQDVAIDELYTIDLRMDKKSKVYPKIPHSRSSLPPHPGAPRGDSTDQPPSVLSEGTRDKKKEALHTSSNPIFTLTRRVYRTGNMV
ncbi:hypothetical protein Hypma_010589 [Hypsizygus marmoreus]|uniref:Uncharacterized protein n=1 Tax=Hypsizygus marmoreus TaxID=39966 RepID=A0A369JIZ0_HYPMA|nr:hypothetical protein Hypma_010589 [Hypsizygus marmoreus]